MTYIWDEVQDMARAQGTCIIRVLPGRYLTQRLDGGEILDPPIYGSLIRAYRALLAPIGAQVDRSEAA